MFNEKLFSSRNLAETVSLICGASKSTVLGGCKGNSETKVTNPRGRKSNLIISINGQCLGPGILMVTRIYEESPKIPGFPQIGRIKLHKELKKLGFVYKSRNIKMQVYRRLDIVSWPRGRNI